MNKRAGIILFAVLLALTAMACGNPSAGSFTVTVLDCQQQPLPDAMVLVDYTWDSSARTQSFTDSAGRARVDFVYAPRPDNVVLVSIIHPQYLRHDLSPTGVPPDATITLVAIADPDASRCLLLPDQDRGQAWARFLDCFVGLREYLQQRPWGSERAQVVAGYRRVYGELRRTHPSPADDMYEAACARAIAELEQGRPVPEDLLP